MIVPSGTMIIKATVCALEAAHVSRMKDVDIPALSDLVGGLAQSWGQDGQ
jgi:hypothetical protein